MRNRPSAPSTIGVGKTIFNPARLAVITFLLLCASLAPTQAQAGTATPLTHELKVSFDLDRARLHGVSTIDFPAGVGDSYHMPGLTIEEIRINDQVVDLKNRNQPYFADPLHELTIDPGDQPRRVVVVYSLTLDHRTSPLSDLIGPEGISLTGLWHPLLHRDTLFHLEARIPAGFEAISEAESITSVTSDEGKVEKFNFDHPLPRINLIAGPFVVEKTTLGADLDLYTYFFPEDRELAADYRDKAKAYLQRYEKLIGPFPYRRFSVVENRLPTGYSMPTFTVLGQAVVRLPFITRTSLGHEILHQWFGNAIRTPEEDGGNWCEGLTTLLADMQYAVEEGRGVENRKTQLNKYQSFVHENNQMTLAQFAGAQSHLISGQEATRAIGYTKAAMVFYMLRKRIGEERFIQSLRNFYKRLAYQQAGWEDLRASFEEVTSEDLSDFFDQWLNRPDIPALTFSKLTIDEEEGRPVLRFTIHQANKSGPYQLQVPVRIYTDTATVDRDIDLKKIDTEVEIPLPSEPRQLVFDENYDLMRRLAHMEVVPTWDRFVGADIKLAVLDPAAGETVFGPLLEMLKSQGVKLLDDDQAMDQDLASGSVIFLGTGSKTSRRLFAKPGLPAEGFTLQVLANPLNPEATAVLVSAEDPNEVLRATPKLSHYGKYSYLQFQGGRIVDKKITDTAMGQRFFLDEPPDGIEVKSELSFDLIVDRLKESRVVYIGETHNRYEDHLLQLRVIRALYHQNPDLAIGMEMFNRADQEVLDAYVLNHEIDEAEFLRRTHYFTNWRYDYRYYQPIVNFARANRIPVIALNLPQKTVSEVFKGEGLSGLTEKQQAQIPPDRDLAMSGYRERIGSFFQMHRQAPGQPGNFNNFLQAQAIWDETMAASVADFLEARPDYRMAVVAGRGHIEKENAIPPRVTRRLAVSQSVLLNAESREITTDTADYVFFSPPAELPPPALMGVILKQEGDRVAIETVSPHGMAGKAGLKEGDIFLALDNQPVKTIEDIRIIMFFKKHGKDKVKVKIRRPRKIFRDQELEFEVQV